MTNDVTFKYKITKRYSGYTEQARILDEIKFVRVIGGHSIWCINGTDHAVQKNDIIIFSKDDIRYIKKVTSEEDFTIEQIVFSPITLYPMQSCADFFFKKPFNFCNVLPKNKPYYEKMIEYFEEIKDEVNNQYPFKNERITNLIISMVICASRIFDHEQSPSIKRSGSQYETVCKAISYIEKNLQNELSRESIAKYLYISPSYLSKIFKEYSGICLQNYIVRARVQRSIQLIRKGLRPIDAAFESGFSSTSGFYRAFRSVTGSKPREQINNLNRFFIERQ